MITYDRARAQKIMMSHGLVNTALIFTAAAHAGLALHGACALMEKESSGKNEWGHDDGGALKGYPGPVTKETYDVMRWLHKNPQRAVINGKVETVTFYSQGTGPGQLTSDGLLDAAEKAGLDPWDPVKNMQFAFQTLAGYKKSLVTWEAAGTAYNGDPAYGVQLAQFVAQWKTALAPAVVKP